MQRAVLLLAIALTAASAQTRITTPKDFFGFSLGDDYQLANYRQISEYWRKLDAESERLVVQEIGKTAEGRPQLMVIATSPANHQNLARYKEISRRLALAEGLSDEQARALAKEGKAVVWIDGGLHATETLGAQQLAQMVYEMASRTDEETLRFLDETIVLLVHANPDGNDLVADWYMRNGDPTKRSTSGLPRLYQKYIGHDNNRDFFASTQAETENINRVLYHEWFPQILYNHHQSGPAGTVVWSSPQRDPYNYNLDPSLILGLQALGTHMHQRLAAEDKPGATMASGGAYDGWWNGGIRNTANFHNIIAILTETIGSPTPMRIPLVPQRQLPNRDLPFPIAPQPWHFKQSVDYSISFNRAVIDYAARNRELLLYGIYKMGRRSIDRGSRDTWTPSPARLQAAQETLGTSGGRGGGDPQREAAVWSSLHTPELRDPRAYIIPAAQQDFPTAVKFINALREVNVAVHRATRPFEVNRKEYPAGSFVIFTAQAFRPHVMDMFEPQVHPNVIPYPGAPPTPPYDNAGWTLAFQMGVEFDRILEPFTGPFEKVTDWNVTIPPPSLGAGEANRCHRRVNDCFLAVNRALKSGRNIFASSEYFSTASGEGTRVRMPRIGLWDQPGGSMESGWTRWILEQFEYPFTVVTTADLEATPPADKFDVLIFVDRAIARDRPFSTLRSFVENGGKVIAIGSSAESLAAHFDLPVDNHLVENGTPLPRSKYFVPGSLLTAKVDTRHPLAAGMRERTDFFFDNSPVFRLKPGATEAGVRSIAMFDGPSPLHSGWAWGQQYLKGGVIALEAQVGKGRVMLYGPEILQRAQPHATFKLLFNALY